VNSTIEIVSFNQSPFSISTKKPPHLSGGGVGTPDLVLPIEKVVLQLPHLVVVNSNQMRQNSRFSIL
tara:strand:+ start:174 stop:374 length:201 start_codon:yes stop_codon:yes gene_type:complete